jgi:hypothetical protein
MAANMRLPRFADVAFLIPVLTARSSRLALGIFVLARELRRRSSMEHGILKYSTNYNAQPGYERDLVHHLRGWSIALLNPIRFLGCLTLLGLSTYSWTLSGEWTHLGLCFTYVRTLSP